MRDEGVQFESRGAQLHLLALCSIHSGEGRAGGAAAAARQGHVPDLLAVGCGLT